MRRIRIRPMIRAAVRALTVMAAVLSFSGCGVGSDPTADPIKAEESLKIALEAWKSGSKSEDLSTRNPSIVVFDPDWKAGSGLIAFEQNAPARQAGNDVVMPVRLTLKTSKGRKIQRNAVYTISTDPKNLIIREEG